MKTVFSNAMCAHVWAQRSQPEGRSNSMRFEGDTIYSYRTAIAQIFAAQDIVLINANRYSVTTSGKHMPAVRNAVRRAICATVPKCEPVSAEDHAANVDYLVKQYVDYAARLRRMRDDPATWNYATLETLANDARRYARAFNLPRVDINDGNEAILIRAFRVERATRLDTPANRAKRERAELKRAEKANADAAEAIAKFRSGESHGIRGLFHALLRYNSSNGTVETSQGATVPAVDAMRACRFVGRVVASGKPWRANGDRVHVGMFEINSVSEKGDIVAGCHRIKWGEIELLTHTLQTHGVDA